MVDRKHDFATVEPLLCMLLRGELQARDVARLARAILHETRFLMAWVAGEKRWSFLDYGLSYDDVAADVVADLLAGSVTEPCEILRSSLLTARNNSDESVALCELLRNILLGAIRQGVFRILAEHDPVRAKLIRSLRRFVTRCTEVVVFTCPAGRLYCSVPEEHSLRNKPVVGVEELAAIIRRENGERNPAVRTLKACLCALEPRRDYRRAVYESDILLLTLERLASEYSVETSECDFQLHQCDLHVVKRAINLATEQTHGWIMDSYVGTGKLSAIEVEAILSSVVEQLLHTGDGRCRKHIDALRRFLPDVTREQFCAKYRRTYLYISKLFLTKVRNMVNHVHP